MKTKVGMKLLGVLGYLVILGLSPSQAKSPWQEMEQQTQTIFERVSPCVVGISVSPKIMRSSPIDPSTLSPESALREAFSSSQEGFKDQLDSLFHRERIASGLVVDPQGYILTTGSILRSATSESVFVTLVNGKVLSATHIAQDPHSNLALFKVDDFFEDVPKFGKSQDLRIGSFVMAITRPYGRDNSFFMGTVSNLGQMLGQTRYENLIQTSIPLHPGSIGSPIMNDRGEIVGLLSATQKQSSWPELSFAIPSEMLSVITRELITEGNVSRGFLGVKILPLTNQLRQEKNLPPALVEVLKEIPESLQGVLVTRLIPGGPAGEAGIEANDIIIGFNGEGIRTYQQLIWQTALVEPGKEIPVEVWRKGETLTYPVKLDRFIRPPEAPANLDSKRP